MRCASLRPGISDASSRRRRAQPASEAASRGANHRSEIGSYHLPISIRSDRMLASGYVWLDPARLFGEGANRRDVRFELLSAMQLNVGQNVPDEVDGISAHPARSCKAGATRQLNDVADETAGIAANTHSGMSRDDAAARIELRDPIQTPDEQSGRRARRRRSLCCGLQARCHLCRAGRLEMSAVLTRIRRLFDGNHTKM